MQEFKSFFKKVGGNEGDRCSITVRMDGYGKGCQHDCNYCYAKSLLDFRGLWNAQEPAAADIRKVRKKIATLPHNSIVRLGGLTDCFQPIEKEYRVTREIIKALQRRNIHYVIVTKSDLILEYMDLMDPRLAHIQITITSTNGGFSLTHEPGAPLPSRRIKAVEQLSARGFDTSIRLSPYIEEYINFDVFNGIQCEKVLIEFLRVNHWIEKWFDIDYSKYTLKGNGYRHLPLDEKIRLLEKLDFPQMSICEDVPEHQEYWKTTFNFDPDDCCNLRKLV